MSKHSTNREQGFTLIELLIAIAVSGLLISALVLGFITTMRGTASAHDRLVASNGNHTLSTYFVSDVQSANATMVSTDPTSNSGCATTEASTTNLVRLQWWEQPTLSEMTAFSVSYRTRQVGTTWELVRYACSTDPFPPAPPLKDVAVAMLANATPTSHVMVSDLYDPSSSSWPTTATNTGREVTLQAYAALATDETVPYGYTVSARLRTLSGGTTTTTTPSSTTSTSTSSTTTTTTTSPTTATKLGLVSCVREDGVTVSCAGPISLANGQWIDISVRLLDASGTPVNATSSVTVNVSSDNESKFAVTGAPVTIADGTSQSSGPFRVTHGNGGNAIITASSGSLTPATVAMN